ncbi:AAA family ATPase [Candidatus Accumulibacter sp. ACC005]|uniref:AAA family ATPase n=1 Tax=Candidatus Accumulibacter sp. ACC005 TaxID=2823331 RepID=UPI0025B8088E|nr:AAA family ATPase [Candidatus Accumulibacter sp. ACC005]
MSKLKSIKVKRFKQLREFELEVDDTTVLIGVNNAGKSSVLQAIHFAVAIAQTAKLVGEGVKWGNDKFELSFNPTQLLYSPVADVLSLAYGGNLIESPLQQIEIEIELDDGASCLVTVRRGRNRNVQVALRGRAVGERLMDFGRPFTVYAPGLAGIAKEERYMSPGVVRRIVARGDANLVLRNVLLMIKEVDRKEKEQYWQRRKDELQRAREDREKGQGPLVASKPLIKRPFKGPWSRFLDDMHSLFPGLSIEVKFDPDRDEAINVYFREGGGPQLPIDAAGTSILQASQILAYVTLFKPQVLILDEPDSHLHPNNQRALCDLVTLLAASRGFRAIISTHSRHVLDSLRDRANIVWLNSGKRVDYDAVTTPAMLLELGALDSVDYFADGQLKCLFATEDSKAESIHALHALLQANGFPLKEVEVRPYSGCSKLDAAKVLRNFLRDKAPNVRFVLHRDRDYMDAGAAEKFEQGLRVIDAHPFITAHSDVEGYFLNATHIAELNPTITQELAQQLIDQAIETTKGKSVEALINIRTETAIRNRNGGPPHNAGELAAKAYTDYESGPAKWCRGKRVLGELRSLLNQELQWHPTILKATKHLVVPELQAIRETIWPTADAAS